MDAARKSGGISWVKAPDPAWVSRGWRGTRRLNPSRETRFSGAYEDRGIFIFAIQLTTSKIGNFTCGWSILCYMWWPYVHIIHTYCRWSRWSRIYNTFFAVQQVLLLTTVIISTLSLLLLPAVCAVHKEVGARWSVTVKNSAYDANEYQRLPQSIYDIYQEYGSTLRLPVLLVVSWTGKMHIPLSLYAPENLVSRDGFSRPVPHQPQGSSSNRCCHFAGHHGPINVRLSFPTPTIGMKSLNHVCWKSYDCFSRRTVG